MGKMTFVDRVKGLLADMDRAEADAAKALPGVFISRPVLNAQEWADWATEWKIPSPVPAAEMHVTIISSTVSVKMIPEDCPIVVAANTGCFCALGPNEEAFAICFQNWRLQDRHWQYIENGAVSSWPTYRAHMTLSMDAKDFDIPAEALAEAPEYIILGAETSAPLKIAAPDDADPEGVETETEDQTIIVVLEIAASAAAAALKSDTLSPVDRTALYDISKGRPVTAGVAKRLAGVAADVSKAILTAEVQKVATAETKKRVETDVSLKMTPRAADVVKKAGLAEVLKSEEEAQLIYAISNVYSIAGELVEDLGGDAFTTPAMEQFIAQVLKRDASSTWEHEGEPRNIVVQGLVLSDQVQKALGIDLGFECLITATHFPDAADWAKAKDGDWEQSIAGRFWHYED